MHFVYRIQTRDLLPRYSCVVHFTDLARSPDSDSVQSPPPSSEPESQILSSTSATPEDPDMKDTRQRMKIYKRRWLNMQRDQILETACLKGIKAQTLQGIRTVNSPGQSAVLDGEEESANSGEYISYFRKNDPSISEVAIITCNSSLRKKSVCFISFF